jgi:arylsulfatase
MSLPLRSLARGWYAALSKTSHRKFLPMQALCRIFVVVLVSLGCSTARCEAPLNVLILYADDWRHDTLGCAGHPIVKTPNIDRLASEGVRFKNNFVTTSICGVSRATLFTGQWMSRHGNRAFEAFKTPWDETYPGVLRERGYHVGLVGKWHNGKFPAERFDFGRSYSGVHWIQQDDGTKVHVTAKNEKDAMDFLTSKPANKPFSLNVSFFATHAEDSNPKQYLPQPESMSLYADIQIPVPKTATDESFKKLPPFIANERNEGRNRWHWRFDTPERYQEYMKNYYRLVTEVDAACGTIIEKLKAIGEYDRTLIVFTTDNGYFHAEHGLADKWYPYEESIRVPLIIRDPRMAKEFVGTVNEQMTLNADLAPTFVTASGGSVPASMQGRDLATLYGKEADQAKKSWRKDYFYEHGIIRDKDFIPASEALVQLDWKYIVWPDFDVEQLFDLTNDRQEEMDLVKSPSHQVRLAEMRTRFQSLKQAAK